MAGRKVMSNAAVVAALVALLFVAAASGEQGYNICGINTKTLKDACGSYCKVRSTESSPNGDCCAVAKRADVSCLCGFKAYLPSDIDPNRAMEIPSKCGVQGGPRSCARA